MEHLVLFIVLHRSKTTRTITHIRFFAQHEFYIEGASMHLYQKRLFRKLGVSSSSSILLAVDFRLRGDMKAQLPFPFFAEPSARLRNWNFKNTNHGKVRSITVYRGYLRTGCQFQRWSRSLRATIQRNGIIEHPSPLDHAWKKIVKFCTRRMGRFRVFVEWN